MTAFKKNCLTQITNPETFIHFKSLKHHYSAQLPHYTGNAAFPLCKPYYLPYLSKIQASYEGFVLLCKLCLKYWNMIRCDVTEPRSVLEREKIWLQPIGKILTSWSAKQ